MKSKKSIFSAMLALAVAFSIGLGTVTQSACTNPNNNSQNEQTETIYYKLTLNLNGGELPEGQNATQFEANKRFVLPTPTRSEYKFAGWFDNEEYSGSAYSQIDKSDATSDKEFWAKWEVAAQTYTVILHLDGGNFKDGFGNVTSYTNGTAVALPEVEKAGYNFIGWYDNANFGGSPVTEIPATATGNKEYYAKWSKTDGNDPDVNPVKYTVTFDYNYDGAVPSTEVEVESGKVVERPADPTRTGYDFIGWFESVDDSTPYNFSSAVTESFTLYAHWQVQTYKVTLNFDGGKIVVGADVKSYTYGEGATLPVLEKSGYTFEGWYESSTFVGDKVTEISKTDTGDKTYYAKWKAVEATSLNVTAFGGYEEGAYIEVDRIKDTKASDYTVSYKPSSSGVAGYTKIDTQLVREIGTTVRADIVGLSAGSYDIKVTANGFTAEKTVQVSAYDRSGYAHFKYDKGVGAYKDDGTLKNNAIVVYVTEETKNTVKATLDGSTYTGIVDILTHASRLSGKNIPLVVRIIGTVGAATWNEINYDKGGNFNDGKDYDQNNKLPASKVIGINGKQLPTDHKDITQEELIAGGYNTLNTSVYSELKGLSSKATWSNGEYDSAWNNCSIIGVSNITVEGIGTDARIFQWGFTWKSSNSIEVRNLTFEDYTEDACSFEGGTDSTTLDGFDSNNIWVHHNTFLEGKNYWDVCPEQDKHEGDGATDFKKNAYITISFNHYFKNHKTGLVGGGDSQKTACLTFHHNWYEKCSSRLPLARQANMHMYNNFYDGSTGQNMSLRAGAYALIENCYFKNANQPITTQSGDGKQGYAKVVNCTFEGCEVSSSYKGKTVLMVSRTTAVSNDNIFAKDFDTNPALFYYDSVKAKSDVTSLTGRNDVPQVVQEHSGVHKN